MNELGARSCINSQQRKYFFYLVGNTFFSKNLVKLISGEKEFQEECIIPDQQNLAHEIQGLCSGDQDDQNTGSSEVLLDNISQKFSSMKELGKPVSKKLSKILIKLFLNDMEEEKFKTINKKYRRPESCPAIVAPKVNSEIWNENLQASHRMTDINLRKTQLLNVSAAYTVTEVFKKW